MPLISAIINVHNGAATLREAIDSVLAQTFADWELILWDDCSTDASAFIAAKYHDPRIRYFLAPEKISLGQARSEAIKLAERPGLLRRCAPRNDERYGSFRNIARWSKYFAARARPQCRPALVA